MREFGDRQYNVFNYRRNGCNDYGLASGYNLFLDFSHGDDQRLSDGCGRLDLYGNRFGRLRRSDGHGPDHGNSQ
jgi:hypothetical protein